MNNTENINTNITETDSITENIKEMKGIEKMKGKFSPKTIAISAAALLIAVTSGLVINRAAHTINLNDYLIVESEGYNGYGEISEMIDWEGIDEKYGDKLEYKGNGNKDYSDFMEYFDISSVDYLRKAVDVDFNETSKLSNDQEVTYEWDINESMAGKFNYKLKYKDGTYKVSGLKEVGTFDAFEDLTVEFYGVSPKGRANVNYLGEDLSCGNFSIDNAENLKNGDKVVVTIDSDCIENCATNLGKIPEQSSKEFIVEGLSSYISRLSDLSAEDMNAMKKQAKEEMESHAAKEFSESETLNSVTYIGSYLLTKKSDTYNDDQNDLFLVYKVKVRDVYSKSEEKFDKEITYYWYIKYEDVRVSSDGKLINGITDYDTPSHRFTVDSGISTGWFGTQSWYYYGYESIASLYSSVVTANANNYNHEDNVSEK